MSHLHSFDFSGQRALVRVDFNVPLQNGRVSDDTRIRAALPTIQHILGKGGSVVLMSHMGRPKDREPEFSLSQIAPTLSSLLNKPVQTADDCIGDAAFEKSSQLQPGEVLLLENLRYHPEEKAGDAEFARALARHGDVYVNDAYGTAHRAHASTAVVAEYIDAAMPGLLLEAEVNNIKKVLDGPEHPFTAIIGGAKVSSKFGILENLLDKVQHIIIGGGMSYTFFKAQGGKVGDSLVEDDFLEQARLLLDKAKENNVQLHLPVDSVVADKFAADANHQVLSSDSIPDGWMGLDIGPTSRSHYSSIILGSKTILWNGPMGVFEMAPFAQGTKDVAEAVASATREHGAYSLVGGGDSVAAVNQFGLADQVSYISTGGGAMLESLEGKVLPGVKAVMGD